MKRKIIGILICMLLITTVIPFGISADPSIKIIYVDIENTTPPWLGTLEDPFQYIQDGIDASENGDTVFVFDGTYYENVFVTSSVYLMGESKENTIIDSSLSGCGHTVFMETSSITIDNFTLANGGYYRNSKGIHDTESTHLTDLTFKNLIITNFQTGIFLRDVSYVTIENCEIYDNYLESIMVGTVMHININNCVVHDNGHYEYPRVYWGSVIVEGDYGFLSQHIEISECDIYDNRYAGIALLACGILDFGDNNIIHDNEIYENEQYGIALWGVQLTEIYNNNIFENWDRGIHSESGCYGFDNHGVYIYDNTVESNGGNSQRDGGIYLAEFEQSSIENNIIESNSRTGIYLFRCNDIGIFDNILQYNELQGICLDKSSYNEIKGNAITDSLLYGILLKNHILNRNNIISSNTFANIVSDEWNGYGIYCNLETSDNNFYHNNFISNLVNARDRGTNIWDNNELREGNYWDDWLSNPGFPFNYIISGEGESIDNYPLLFPKNLPSINLPPNKPYKPVGRTYIHKWRTFYYSTSSWDVNGDQIYYLFDWGDGTDSGWFGPYNSGQIVTAGHQWSSWGTYEIKVKAKDEHGYEGAIYSNPKEIHVGLGGVIEGTMISMGEGSGPVYKPVQQIQIGDIILSYDESTQTLVPAQVVRVYVNTEYLPPSHLTLNNDLKVTPNKDIYINGTWDVAEVAEIDDTLLETDGQTVWPDPIFDIAEPLGTYTAYDLVIQPLYGEAYGYWANDHLVASAPPE